MSTINTFQELYIDQLKDLYNAENQLMKALPAMAKAAFDPVLKRAFEKHLKETLEHVERLEQIFSDLDESPKGKKCKAMEGLIEEGKEMIAEDAPEAVKDAGLIAAAQRVEHYEIAGYGCVHAYAELLGYEAAAELLKTTLEEESDTDEKLSELARNLNVEANSVTMA
jgi:ferritin-like metal-binding protein YciE